MGSKESSAGSGEGAKGRRRRAVCERCGRAQWLTLEQAATLYETPPRGIVICAECGGNLRAVEARGREERPVRGVW